MQFPEARILLFCRAPVAGEVKTRLARGIGHQAAARWHQALAKHCLESVSTAQLAPLQLWCSPDTRHDFFARQQARLSLSLHGQRGPDLGARMRHAFDVALADADYALVIGTDCPALSAGYLRQALAALRDGVPAVIGPAEDGGYVMLGLRRNQGPLFEAMPWGSDAVFETTCQRMAGDYRVLPPLWDVDVVEDLQRLKQEADKLKLSGELKRCLSTFSAIPRGHTKRADPA